MSRPGNWVSLPIPRPEWIQDLDGVSWDEVPKPRRWHRCRAQTRGFVLGDYVERCPCGGMSAPARFKGWIERNSR